MENLTNKNFFDKFSNLLGEARGVVFQTDVEYVRSKKGEEGLILVEEELKKIGHPIDYKNIKATGWYPLGLRVISLLVIKNIFNWGDKEIENMGNTAPKYSFIVKLMLRYFLTFSQTYKESPKYWEKHYTVGKLETPDYSLGKKYAIMQIKDFKIDPILCVYLGGYFVRMSQLVLKNAKNFQVKELKCVFKGDSYHEFLITWE